MQTYLGIKRESLGQTWTHIPVLLLSRGMVYKMEIVYLQGCCGKQMKVWMCINILCQYDSSWYLTTLGSSPEIKKRTYQTWRWPYKNMTLLSWEENGKISVRIWSQEYLPRSFLQRSMSVRCTWSWHIFTGDCQCAAAVPWVSERPLFLFRIHLFACTVN